jgi:hypothetical protein
MTSGEAARFSARLSREWPAAHGKTRRPSRARSRARRGRRATAGLPSAAGRAAAVLAGRDEEWPKQGCFLDVCNWVVDGAHAKITTAAAMTSGEAARFSARLSREWPAAHGKTRRPSRARSRARRGRRATAGLPSAAGRAAAVLAGRDEEWPKQGCFLDVCKGIAVTGRPTAHVEIRGVMG